MHIFIYIYIYDAHRLPGDRAGDTAAVAFDERLCLLPLQAAAKP